MLRYAPTGAIRKERDIMRNLRELDSDIEIVNDPLEGDDLSNQTSDDGND